MVWWKSLWIVVKPFVVVAATAVVAEIAKEFVEESRRPSTN